MLILKRVNNTAYELQLPSTSKMHPVVNVSRLRRFSPRLDKFADDEGNDTNPPPDLIDDEEEYEVEALLKYDDATKQFLVKWKGWEHFHNTWEDKSMLQRNAAEMVDEYFARHPPPRKAGRKVQPVVDRTDGKRRRPIKRPISNSARVTRSQRYINSLPMMISVNNMYQQVPFM